MRNDADKTPTLLQVLQCLNRAIQFFRIKRAKTLINEDRVESNATLIRLDDIRQTQRQSE